MTDAEIIKALERCSEAHNCGVCNYEPTEYKKGTIGCSNQIMEYALDLINRQKAEIERLNIRLRKVQHQFADLGKMYSEIRAEAIKEFAERLKESKHECGCNYRKKPVYAVTEDKIDNLVKEMAGDTECQ